MTRKVVLMNDTSTRYHHGCARVMRLLRQGLEERGARILAASPARHDWANDPVFLGALKDCDVVVINGEGTLHHGADAGARLLSVAEHEAARGKKLCLVNALYDENPTEWESWLQSFSVLSARDSESARQLSEASGRNVDWLPDLSLSHPAEVTNVTRKGTVLGDSVRMERRQALARSANRFKPSTFVPTKTLRQPIWRVPVLGGVLRSALYNIYNGHLTLTPPRFEMPLTEQAYLARIAASDLHITGRFHAVCLSLLTRTPFLALTSTSGKIEKLLTDLGLGTNRIVSDEDLLTINPDPRTHQFSEQELQIISQSLSHAQTKASELFDKVLA